MLYRMRRKDGTTDPFSSGSLVERDSALQHLAVTDFKICTLGDLGAGASTL